MISGVSTSDILTISTALLTIISQVYFKSWTATVHGSPPTGGGGGGGTHLGQRLLDVLTQWFIQDS